MERIILRSQRIQSDKERQINTYLQSDVVNAKGAKEKLSVQVGTSSWKRSH